MAMTTDSIKKVDDARTHLLLSEPRFLISGTGYQLLSPTELKARRITAIPGVSNEDITSEGILIDRNVANLVKLVQEDIHFNLEDIANARLIFTIIDHFLLAQSRLIVARLGGLQDYMIDDFMGLTKLANIMLGLMSVSDKIDLMNVPEDNKVLYTSVFDLLLSDKADNVLTKLDSVVTAAVEEDNGYISPFSEVLRHRKSMNRISRFVI